MTRTDYHLHSYFSVDGHSSPREICIQALTSGYAEIAITDHAEWHDGENGFADLHHYLEAIGECRQRFGPLGLTVLAGVELGNPHEFRPEVTSLLAGNHFDVVIGSLHYLAGVDIESPACFRGRDPYDVMGRYFKELAYMCAEAPCRIVGHIDRILLQPTEIGLHFDPHLLETEIRAALATIISRELTLELNGKYLAHQPNWIGPLTTILRWYREMGGNKLALNSDAHHVSELGRNLGAAQAILSEAGYELAPGATLLGDRPYVERTRIEPAPALAAHSRIRTRFATW